MSRIVVDVDGLIKLGKAGVLGTLLEEHEVLVPEAVYEEAVVSGKRELYEDAFELERVLESGGARILGAEGGEEDAAASLGPGEQAALILHRERGPEAILSDDRVFLRFLEGESVPYLTPASAVVGLVESGKLCAGEGIAAVDRLRGHVREPVRRAARERIERGEEENE